jgi:hypothetical protein
LVAFGVQQVTRQPLSWLVVGPLHFQKISGFSSSSYCHRSRQKAKKSKTAGGVGIDATGTTSKPHYSFDDIEGI